MAKNELMSMNPELLEKAACLRDLTEQIQHLTAQMHEIDVACDRLIIERNRVREEVGDLVMAIADEKVYGAGGPCPECGGWVPTGRECPMCHVRQIREVAE